MNETSIEWCDATWNPTRGCSRVSEGCRHCYAERVAARFSGSFDAVGADAEAGLDAGAQPFAGFAKRVGGEARWTGRVELVRSAIDWPLRVRRPAWVRRAEEEGRRPRIFVNSMSDLFHERLSDEDIDRVFAVMALEQRFDFLVLTKRPERMRRYLSDHAAGGRHVWPAAQAIPMPGRRNKPAPGWPLPNVWLITSVEDQPTADERIPHLLATPAAIRGVSYEPALGPVDFRCIRHTRLPSGARDLEVDALTGTGTYTSVYNVRGIEAHGDRLDWLIVGGESGPGARPCDLAWLRSARDQCKAAGVAFFFKQLGARPGYKASEGVLGALPGPDAEALEDRGDGWHTWILRDRKGGDPSEWPEDLRVREWPRSGGER